MSVIQSYNASKVTLLSYSKNPKELIKKALGLTTGASSFTDTSLKQIWSMGHKSVFEHVAFSFLIENISRNCAMQITRHRIGSFTMFSQHYQLQSSQKYSFSSKISSAHKKELQIILKKSQYFYKELLKFLPKEEARQILPGAIQTNLIWSTNLRSLAHFLNLRKCFRNIEEVRVVANKIQKEVFSVFPLITYFGMLDCEKGKCKQSYLQCSQKKEKNESKS